MCFVLRERLIALGLNTHENPAALGTRTIYDVSKTRHPWPPRAPFYQGSRWFATLGPCAYLHRVVDKLCLIDPDMGYSEFGLIAVHRYITLQILNQTIVLAQREI